MVEKFRSFLGLMFLFVFVLVMGDEQLISTMEQVLLELNEKSSTGFLSASFILIKPSSWQVEQCKNEIFISQSTLNLVPLSLILNRWH